MKLIKVLYAFVLSFFATKEIYGGREDFELYKALGLKAKNKTDQWNRKETEKASEAGNLDRADERASSTDHYELDIEHVDREESFEELEAVDSSCYEGYEEELEQSLEQYCNLEGIDLNNLENVEHYRRHKILGNMRRRHGRKGGVYAAHQLGQKGLTGNVDGVAAQLTYVVTRNTFNINQGLPIHMWNWLDYQAGFPQILAACPPGVTLVGTSAAANGNLTFVFALIANPATIDTVTISCLQTPYLTLLNSTITDKYQVGGGPPHQTGGTLQLSDPTQNALQFGQTLWKMSDRDPLGNDKSYLISPGSFFSSMQFQNAILDIKLTWGIDRQRGVIYTTAYVPTATPGYVLSTTFNIMYSQVHQDSIDGHKPLNGTRHHLGRKHRHHNRHHR